MRKQAILLSLAFISSCSTIDHGASVTAELNARYSPGGLSVTQVTGNGIEVRGLDGASERFPIPIGRDVLHGIMSFDGSLLVAADGQGLFCIELPSGRLRWAVDEQQVDPIISMSTDNSTVAASARNRVFAVDVDSGMSRTVASGHSPSLGKDGGELLFSDGSSVLKHDLISGTTAVLFSGSEPSWSPTNNEIAYRNPSGDFEIASPYAKKRVLLRDGKDILRSPAWTPDGNFILVVRRKSLSFWSLETREPKTLSVVRASDGAESPLFDVYKGNQLLYTWVKGHAILKRE